MSNPEEALKAFPAGNAHAIIPLKTGLIHATYRVEAEQGTFVLQRMNKIFEEAVLTDMMHVTEHLKAKGMQTFALVRANDGALSHFDGSSHWRLLTYIEGISVHSPSLEQIESAGELVGRFHEAMADASFEFEHKLKAFHNTERYIERLRILDESEKGTEKHQALSGMTAYVLGRLAALPFLFKEEPTHVMHGDPKLENVLFESETGKAVALIDLDTAGRYSHAIEIGDMLRSWTMVPGAAEFSVERWKAALSGYRKSSPFALDDATCMQAMIQISLELTVRFIIDAYEEKYFLHNPAKYATLYEQNLEFAKHTLGVLKDFDQKRDLL